MIFATVPSENADRELITFSDVAPDAWYRPYVIAASKYGIIMRDNSDKFVPERNVAREEFVTMLGRLLK